MTSGDLVHPSARSRRYWLWGVAIFAMVMAAIVWFAYSRVLAYELLSTAPDAISGDGRLDRYAQARAELCLRHVAAAQLTSEPDAEVFDVLHCTHSPLVPAGPPR